jgi:RNA polymerase sigma factor (sigma-70 family)
MTGRGVLATVDGIGEVTTSKGYPRMSTCVCPPKDCAGLVGRCSNDNAAFAELYAIHLASVSKIVRSRLGRRRRAEWDDCVQGIEIRILTNLPKWSRRAPFCHWVGAVAYRAAIDWVRRPITVELTGVEPTVPESPPAPEDVIKCVEDAATRFPDKIREVYVMKLEGLTNEEIARHLGVGIASVYNRLRMMRDLLRHCLER